MASSERFGFEWEKYSNIDPNYEAQFINWIHPFCKKDFYDKDILDAGCGMGRNSYWAIKWGAKSLMAFDFDVRSIKAAKKNLSQFDNTKVEYKSIYDIDWNDRFDVVFSIGVIHHLKNPLLALSNLIKALRPGGILLVWVYSYEGNEWVVKYINPIRIHLTSKLPLNFVHFISYFFSIPLWIFVKIFKGSSDYFKQLSTFKFCHIHSIVFDQLIPEVANYWKKMDVDSIFRQLDLDHFRIYQPQNRCGWTVIAKK